MTTVALTNFNALIDDDGSNTVGSIIDKATLASVILTPVQAAISALDAVDTAAVAARWTLFTTTLTGNQDNLAYSEAELIRCDNATALTLRGLLAPAAPLKPGKHLLVVAVGAGTVTLNDQDTNSTAANRIVTGTAAPLVLTAGTGWALVVYDGTTARYRVTGSSAASAASPVVQSTTSTGTINDFALTANAAVLRCNNATLLTLTGLSAGVDGQLLTIESVGAGQVNVNDQVITTSAAANRVITGNSATHAYEAGAGTCTLRYDATTLRWRIVHEKTMRFRCHAYKSATQSLANNTTSVVTYDLEVVDVGALHDNSTNPSRFTIPVGGTGQWLVVFHTGFTTSTNARFTINLNKNGAGYLGGFDIQATPTSGLLEIGAPAVVINAVEGDYFEQTAYQNTGIAVNLNYSVPYSTSMSMIKLD